MDSIGALPQLGDPEQADPDATVINYPGRAGGPAPVGGRTYREEYLRNLGSNLDEWLEGSESG